MQGTKKESIISIAKSTPDSDHSGQSWRSPTESHCQESALSTKSDLNMGVPAQRYQSEKLLDFSLQDQDSCSTQSTGQSYSRISNNGENNLNSQRMFSTQSGYYVTNGKHEGSENLYSSVGSQSYSLPHLQADCNQYFPQLAVPYSDQFVNGVLSTYGPQAVVMGVMPARVPLPLDFSTSEPIYVNPKQYHGILRRRQHRAKLEAQSKLVKNRKPYLHESRHQHALKRARGTGGRFLNSQKLQPSKLASATDDHNISGSVQLHLAQNRSASQLHQQENHREGASTPSCSDVTSTSTSDDIYHPLDFSFSSYPSRVGGTMQGGRGNYI